MTKKEQAIKAVHIYIGDSVFSGDKWPFDFDDKLRSLVHAIDEAEREERGVVDIQEITDCEHCEFFNEEWLMCDHDNAPKERHEIGTRIPSWCPRRKENRPNA